MAVLLSNKKRKVSKNLNGSGTRHGEKFWAEEKANNNFGVKYMEKFGWNQGDGLGAKRQGSTNHIRVRCKTDNLGIGANMHTNDSMFRATMCMFNDILSRLSTKKEKNLTETTPKEAPKPNLSAAATIQQYEAKFNLYSQFRKASNLPDQYKKIPQIDSNQSKSGFSSKTQEEISDHINNLASQHSGNHGLGYKSNHNNFNNFTSSFDYFNKSNGVGASKIGSQDNNEIGVKRESANILTTCAIDNQSSMITTTILTSSSSSSSSPPPTLSETIKSKNKKKRKLDENGEIIQKKKKIKSNEISSNDSNLILPSSEISANLDNNSNNDEDKKIKKEKKSKNKKEKKEEKEKKKERKREEKKKKKEKKEKKGKKSKKMKTDPDNDNNDKDKDKDR